MNYLDLLLCEIGNVAPHVIEKNGNVFGADRIEKFKFLRQGVARFIVETGADEIIVASAIFDHEARVRSLELLAGAVAL